MIWSVYFPKQPHIKIFGGTATIQNNYVPLYRKYPDNPMQAEK